MDNSNELATVSGESELLSSLSNFALTPDERSQIIEAGMPLAENYLKSRTPKEAKDVEGKTLYGKEIGHLFEGVTHKKKQNLDGTTSLGFSSRYYPIAIWTDWGTYRQKPQFWFEKAFTEFPKEEFFEKQVGEAKNVMRKKKLL